MDPESSPLATGGDAAASAMQTTTRVRVRYCECDPMGMAHHSIYPVWMEMVRGEHLRTRGVAYRLLEERGVHFVVAKINIRFKRPARYDDQLDIHVQEEPSGRTRNRIKVDHTYRITHQGRLLATGSTTLVCVDGSGTPQPIPDGSIG